MSASSSFFQIDCRGSSSEKWWAAAKYVTPEAQAVRDSVLKNELSKGKLSKLLRYEHVYPFNLLYDQAVQLPEITSDSVKSFLDAFYLTCLVTTEQNALLDAAGFKKDMPSGWGDNLWARYDHADVNLRVIENECRWAS